MQLFYLYVSIAILVSIASNALAENPFYLTTTVNAYSGFSSRLNSNAFDTYIPTTVPTKAPSVTVAPSLVPTLAPSVSPTPAPSVATIAVIVVNQGLSNMTVATWNANANCGPAFIATVYSTLGSGYSYAIVSINSVASGSRRNLQHSEAGKSLQQALPSINVDYNIILSTSSPTAATAVYTQVNNIMVSAVDTGQFTDQMVIEATSLGVNVLTYAKSETVDLVLLTPVFSPTKAPSSDPSSSPAKLSGGAVAGIVIASIAVVSALGFGVYKFMFVNDQSFGGLGDKSLGGDQYFNNPMSEGRKDITSDL